MKNAGSFFDSVPSLARDNTIDGIPFLPSICDQMTMHEAEAELGFALLLSSGALPSRTDQKLQSGERNPALVRDSINKLPRVDQRPSSDL